MNSLLIEAIKNATLEGLKDLPVFDLKDLLSVTDMTKVFGKDKTRFLCGRDPKYAYLYSAIIESESRFLEAESVIAKSPEWAYYYAKNILEKRFQEAEPVIATNPQYAYLYARDILKQRWPEAEPTILTDPIYRQAYKNLFEYEIPI